MMMFFTGSYTQEGAPAAIPLGTGISCFDLDENSGEIRFLHSSKQRNPSYLVVSADKKFLYAVEEMYEELNPQIFAYKIESGGKLRLLNSQKIKGDYACHLAIIQDRLVLANYVSGNALAYPILKDGSLAPFDQEIKHHGHGPNKERQEAAHAHMIYPFKKNCMYVLDLSLDKAKAYQLERDSKQWKAVPACDIQIDAGSGARHLVMDKTEQIAFVLSELSGEVFVADLRRGERKIVQKISFIPETYNGNAAGAAIRIHPNGKYLYASNRGSDTIAIFKIDKESKHLILVEHQSTKGKTPRDFNISLSGNWLIVANQDSDELVVFKLKQDKGILIKHSSISTGTPVNICWR